MTTTLPPGPKLPALVQTALAVWGSTKTLQRCHRRYGDKFAVRLLGMGTVVYVTDPADIRTVLRGDPAIFHAGEANAPLAEILGPRSVLVTDDEAHRRSRSLLLPAFHGESVRRQVDEMVHVTADEVATWPRGERLPLLGRMQAITLEVILRTVIGVHDETRLAALRAALPPLVDIGSPIELLPPPPLLRHVGLWRRRERVKARAHALLRDEIAHTRTDPQLDERTDVLAMLVRAADSDGGVPSDDQLSDDELVDQLVTLLLAGHETTATGLAWTFERITRDRGLLARVVTAADDGDDAFLDAVCKESLRARPVVFEFGRRVTEPVDLAGYRLPAGTMIVPSIVLVHRSGRNYPQPEQFRPERFLEVKADPSTWLPFGGGTRRCLGATFAQVEMRTVLREVLRRVELEATDEPAEQARVRHVTLVPEQGAAVVAHARQPAVTPG